MFRLFSLIVRENKGFPPGHQQTGVFGKFRQALFTGGGGYLELLEPLGEFRQFDIGFGVSLLL